MEIPQHQDSGESIDEGLDKELWKQYFPDYDSDDEELIQLCRHHHDRLQTSVDVVLTNGENYPPSDRARAVARDYYRGDDMFKITEGKTLEELEEISNSLRRIRTVMEQDMRKLP